MRGSDRQEKDAPSPRETLARETFARESLPCEIVAPERLFSPLVFSSPHSGQTYPPEFLAHSRLDLNALRSSEDVLVDDLFGAAPRHGAPLLRAHFPRAMIDVNREAYELDAKLFAETPPSFANTRSLRVAAGLGVIPRVVAEGKAIYDDRIPLAEGLRRIEAFYKPYHAMLEGLMAQAIDAFGVAVLIDCHSMPSRMPTGDARRPYDPLNVDIVIGDRYGASCDAGFAHRVHRFLSELGYRVARNKPYAGGFITENYASRLHHRHALQIEINRALYLDEATLELKPDYARVKADMTRLIAEMAPAREIPGAHWRQAAE
jgi:N-formylglutamate amidohydrolase